MSTEFNLRKQIKKHLNNNDNIDDLLNIFGGVDNLLTLLLQSNGNQYDSKHR